MDKYEYTIKVTPFTPSSPADIHIEMQDMGALGWIILHMQWESDHCAVFYQRLRR